MTAIGLPAGVLWGVILAIAVGTFASRLSFIVLFGRLQEVPARVERLLSFVAPAALAALVLPALLLVDGTPALSPGNERLVAGAAAALVAWRTESLLATVAVGMAAFWALRFVV